ncbi:MAG: pyrroline-5-carboxylate reductase [Bacillota bacterium]|nr:pyrroline-5-carboxylate reductase [Bacillota bacterium]
MKIGLIGFGQMGSAIARGLLKSGAVEPSSLWACDIDRAALEARTAELGIHAAAYAAALIEAVDFVVLAVKPALLASVVTPVACALAQRPLLSILAGRRLADFRPLLPEGARVQCVVPNTPVAVGRGVWVCERESTFTPEDQENFARIFGQTGSIEYVDGALLGIAGTLTACGPAYAALMQEALGDVSVYYGLPRAVAYRLAAAMIGGYGELALETGDHPAALKDQVCSPGGTTIRGVLAMEGAGFQAAVHAAIRAAMGD